MYDFECSNVFSKTILQAANRLDLVDKKQTGSITMSHVIKNNNGKLKNQTRRISVMEDLKFPTSHQLINVGSS
jgi:hypothetical protein